MAPLLTRLRSLITRPREALRRLRGTSGTALTELAIVAPCFVLLMFWAEFFTDLGIVKMKTEEASRYLVWEMVAQRDPATVQAEVLARFPDLNSPVSIVESHPSTRSFSTVTIAPAYLPPQNTPLQGNIPQNELRVPNTGILDVSADIINGLSGFLSSSANSLVQKFHFNTQREMQSTVEYDVNNTLFPGGSVLGVFFNTTTNLSGQDAVSHLKFVSKSPLLLVDTWKAWPGPYGRNVSTTETPPSSTYSTGGANAVENETSTRMADVAFFAAIPGALGVIDFIFTIIDMPGPFSTSTWKSHDGPIVMLAGKEAKHTWQPQSGTPIQKVGNQYILPTAAGMDKNLSSPVTGVDRTRFSAPSNINSPFWGGIGGLNSATGTVKKITENTTLFSIGNLNPYPAMYDCRDGYYMGSTLPQLVRSVNASGNAAFYTASWPACAGATTSGGGTGGGGPWG